MDDLLEMLELPLEVYAEYWAGIRYLARESPLFTALYVVIALILAIQLIRWLRSRPITFSAPTSAVSRSPCSCCPAPSLKAS
jgi:hypothetical protein